MLEFFIVRKLCIWMGENAQEKGRRAFGYQSMLVAFWFLGEFGLGLLIWFLLMLVHGPTEKDILWIYLGSLAGAIFGAFTAFRIVAGLPEIDEGTTVVPPVHAEGSSISAESKPQIEE